MCLCAYKDWRWSGAGDMPERAMQLGLEESKLMVSQGNWYFCRRRDGVKEVQQRMTLEGRTKIIYLPIASAASWLRQSRDTLLPRSSMLLTSLGWCPIWSAVCACMHLQCVPMQCLVHKYGTCMAELCMGKQVLQCVHGGVGCECWHCWSSMQFEWCGNWMEIRKPRGQGVTRRKSVWLMPVRVMCPRPATWTIMDSRQQDNRNSKQCIKDIRTALSWMNTF
jgi:hypothetical protein